MEAVISSWQILRNACYISSPFLHILTFSSRSFVQNNFAGGFLSYFFLIFSFLLFFFFFGQKEGQISVASIWQKRKRAYFKFLTTPKNLIWCPKEQKAQTVLPHWHHTCRDLWCNLETSSQS